MRCIFTALAIVAALTCGVIVGHGPSFAASNDSLLTQQEKRDLLIGTWFGETPPNTGGRVQWIIEREKDGTYRIQFRIFGADGSSGTHLETGIWGISGPVYFSATQGWRQGSEIVGTDTTQARFYDAYEILSLKESLFEYQHYVTGTKYKVRKVRRGFKFPN